MSSVDPLSTLLSGLQAAGTCLERFSRPLAEGLAALQLPDWLAIPLTGLRILGGIVLILLGLLLLGRLADLVPALTLLVDRGRELASRLWRLLRAAAAELVRVDPGRRAARHARWRQGSDGEPTLAAAMRMLLLDLLWWPIDWLAGLGLQRLLRPDPASERKQERRRLEQAGLARRLGWVWERHAPLPLGLSVLRLLAPRLWLPRWLWKGVVRPDSYGEAFPINGMLWLSLNADVREVLERPDNFEVVYGPRMRLVTQPMDLSSEDELTAGPGEHGNFLLGMQNTPRYYRDISNMRLAFRREDAERCRLLAERAAAAALRRALNKHPQAPGPRRLNLPIDLVVPVAETLINEYFGIPVPLRAHGSESTLHPTDAGLKPLHGEPMIDVNHRWLEALFHHIFYDIKGENSLIDCQRYAPLVRHAMQEIIQRRRHQMTHGVATDADDVLSRCLRLQRSGTPGMDDETLRVNLTGFLVGAMTPLINATCQVVDVLLERPRALRQTMEAARGSGDPADPADPEALRACVMEALRFWPGDPVIWRWTNADCAIGAGSRRCVVPRGTLVMAWNSSAMFDPALVAAPWEFRCDRPAGSYMHWGHGQHSCAGAYLNMAVIPGMLAPLLRQRRIERAPGLAGQPRPEGRGGITIRRFELLVRPRP